MAKHHYKFITMRIQDIQPSDVLLAISDNGYTPTNLVAILELLVHNLEVDTISGMARKEGKSPNGIRKSNAYRKIKIGNQVMAVKGLRELNLPF